MTDIQRKWMPSEYQDETVPPARATPSDWIVKAADGTPALACGDYNGSNEPCRALHEGDVIAFDWSESYGTRVLTFHDADDGWTWSLDGDEPAPSAGGDLTVAEYGVWESAMPSLEELAENYEPKADGSTITVAFYAWSARPTDFVFRGGRFEPVEQPK